MQAQPFHESLHVMLLDQEEPAETCEFLRQQLAHAALPQEVAAVAVGEEALELALRILRMHFSAEDGLELVGAVWVQVAGG